MADALVPPLICSEKVNMTNEIPLTRNADAFRVRGRAPNASLG
jgi:hypothetical protein